MKKKKTGKKKKAGKKKKRKLNDAEKRIMNVGFPEAKGWKNKFDRFFYPEKFENQIIAHFKLRIGKRVTFKVSVNDRNLFEFLGGMYVVDEKLLRHNKSFGLDELFYIEGISLPIDMTVESDKLTTNLKKHYHENGQQDLTVLLNPHNLRAVVLSDAVQDLAKSDQLDAFLKKLWVGLMIIGIATVVHLVLYAKQTNLF